MKMSPTEKLFVNRPEHAARVARRAEKLLEHCVVQAGQRYLEVGCGVGAAARRIAQTRKLDVIGIDIDPDQIRAAESGPALPNLHFLTMDARKLDLADAQFDVVATSKTMHHVADRQRAFREMTRVLRDGGYLIFTDFALPAWFPGAGSLSERGLNSMACETGLARVHRSRNWISVDLIWRKECASKRQSVPVGSALIMDA
jgi:ubiquinone/menaquinone biosynthesis C-methylase UbiE